MLRERCRGVEGFDDFEAIRVGAPDLRAEGYVAEVDAVVNAVRNSAEKREDALFCNVNIDFQKVIRLLLSITLKSTNFHHHAFPPHSRCGHPAGVAPGGATCEDLHHTGRRVIRLVRGTFYWRSSSSTPMGDAVRGSDGGCTRHVRVGGGRCGRFVAVATRPIWKGSKRGHVQRADYT